MDWKKTATRLKELRIEKGLSHAKLKEELEKRYEDFTISELSLKKYEVTDENHRDAKSVCGMKTEYIYYFADFYGVTTDYIIGRSDCREIYADDILKQTGLSETAIKVLSKHTEVNMPSDTLLIGLNYLLELESTDRTFADHSFGDDSVLSLITNYLCTQSMRGTYVCVDENGIRLERKETMLPKSMYMDVFLATRIMNNVYFDRINEKLQYAKNQFVKTDEYTKFMENMRNEKVGYNRLIEQMEKLGIKSLNSKNFDLQKNGNPDKEV